MLAAARSDVKHKLGQNEVYIVMMMTGWFDAYDPERRDRDTVAPYIECP